MKRKPRPYGIVPADDFETTGHYLIAPVAHYPRRYATLPEAQRAYREIREEMPADPGDELCDDRRADDAEADALWGLGGTAP